MKLENAREIRRAARAALAEKGAYWCCFAGLLLLGILASVVIAAVVMALAVGAGAAFALLDTSAVPEARELLSLEGLARISPLLWIYSLTFAGLGAFVLVYLIGFMTWSKTAMAIAIERRGLVIGHAFSGWGHGFHMGWIELVRLTYAQLWLCLFIVPGIVKIFSYALTSYVAVDHPDWSGTQCITESRRLMVGQKGRLFRLWMSFIPWYALAACATLIPLVGQFSFTFITPYVMAATAAFYEDILSDADEGAKPRPGA